MINSIFSPDKSLDKYLFLRLKNKIIGKNILLENKPYYLKHFLWDTSITIANKEGSELIRLDFIRLINDVELGRIITLEKISISCGSLDYCFKIKMAHSAQDGYNYIIQNTIEHLYLYLNKRDNVTCCIYKHCLKIYVQG